MSVNYAEGLSAYEHKGKVNLSEQFDSDEILEWKLDELASLVRASRHLVVHTGAGISTSAGIPDFRGPNGVWTLEERGEKPQVDLTWEDALPTPTHMALVALERAKILKYVVTQNVDGLHLRSGFPRDRLSFLHGDVFVEECEKCGAQFVNLFPVPTMAQRRTGNVCETTRTKSGGRSCRGKLKDTILDWEADLPEVDAVAAEEHAKLADLSLTLGTSLQIIPAGNFPTYVKRKKKAGAAAVTRAEGADKVESEDSIGKLVIVSLSATKHDKKADLRIYAKVDEVMRGLMSRLEIPIPKREIVIPILNSTHPLEDKKGRVISVVRFNSSLMKLEKEEGRKDSKPDLTTDSKPDFITESKADSSADSKRDSKGDSNADMNADSKANSKADSKADSKAHRLKISDSLPLKKEIDMKEDPSPFSTEVVADEPDVKRCKNDV